MNLAQSIITRNLEKHALKAAVGFKKENQWKELSWKKFSEMIAKTANALKAAGIQENDSVAIYSENSAEWITFDLAILSLGAITVPIYSTNNAEQAEYIINDSQSKIILAGNQEQYNTCYELLQRNEYLKTIVVAKNKVIGKKENTVFLREFIANQPSTFEFCPKEDDDTATLIYTSGTTGIPKGVMITHGNFRKEFDAHFEFFKFKNFEDELSLAFLPLTHVFERSWSLLSLYGGAKVYFLEDPKNIAHALIEVKPTMMCTVPRFFQKVYAGIHDVVEKSSPTKKKIFNWSLGIGKQYAELKRTEKEIPFGLKAKHGLADLLVFSKMKEKLGGRLWFTPCGGASISPEVTEFFDAIGLHLTVGYGLTETTATLSLFPFTKYKYGSCGKILPGVEIRIGADNEIQARGSGIMKGYFNKPEETKAVFTEDGWFKTGDAGNIDDQGNLTITERIKDLLKTSNGKYIAPQQVENILSNNNYIQQVMVVAEGRQFVSALIVPNFEFLKGELGKMNIPFTSWNEIVRNEAVNKLYKTKIEEFQTSLASFEKVKKFVLMPAEFEIGSGEITPTLKIKRKVVSEKYKDLIEQMYS
ncbi:TPA: long-chain fatty acid--CoA ligase [Elizabethkingia anophelis]|uniref:AMP-dependent synthetase/ligase n=1 Tax=Elizabethkingia anophelis TaxID=1117645 RepID=UPI00040B64B7|nr:long-chain fatty acid--CoA ligase [Elizabethkingia anophelis]MCT3744220.1 long-chain fatty acid--CoA ligase [Elizabethkingia anophelis]MDV3491083.1 long-chain fatty acid--CoA ligase [Elizabethkingia anophelis]HAT3993317.1 long-chain fatty acid--CoA ligase [Elizabethkingia anophelis]HAT3994542.1 long-chain fatty acid--CoA ligase [Elizabethkingia anophelis]HAT3996957.1 long-chain fatty acid--CoA ligase [Elizabethkingia anophelis]